MKKINPEFLIKKLIPVFYQAGAKSIKCSKKLKIHIKEDGTPVSNGDLEVDAIIQSFLKKITPNIEIVSEETIQETKNKTRDTFWLIDPIDGTSSYIKGGSEYTINVGLIIKKRLLLVLFMPQKKRGYFIAMEKTNLMKFIIKRKKLNLIVQKN